MKPSQILAFAAAIAFVLHASCNDVHSWPLVWPFLAGIVAVVAGRRNASYRYRGIIRNGLWASLLVFILATLSGMIISGDAITRHFQQFNDPPQTNPSLFFAVALITAVFFASWMFGSGIAAVTTKQPAENN